MSNVELNEDTSPYPVYEFGSKVVFEPDRSEALMPWHPQIGTVGKVITRDDTEEEETVLVKWEAMRVGKWHTDECFINKRRIVPLSINQVESDELDRMFSEF